MTPIIFFVVDDPVKAGLVATEIAPKAAAVVGKIGEVIALIQSITTFAIA